MRARTSDPRHLDVEAFARAGAELSGELPLAAMSRLVESTHADEPPSPDAVVRWRARGEMRAQRGGPAAIWMHLQAAATLSLVCQRCLGPVAHEATVSRDFRFVAGEAEAAALDADSDDDVLALTRALDLPALIEDELLLELPLVPRHEHCPQPLPLSHDPLDVADEVRAGAFAALAALKSRATQ